MAADTPGSAGAPQPSPWHARPADEVLAVLATGADGLTSEQAADRLAEHGPNALEAVRPVPWWHLLARQFRSLVVGLLVVAAAVSLALGDAVEAIAIAAVLVLNAAFGFWTEWRSRKALDALRRLQVQSAVVLRDGREQAVDARELVPGDLVLLEPGGAVPADARLVETAELTTIEAPLTGESTAVRKTAEPSPADATLPERRSMVYKGTLVSTGTARAVVVGTGRDTEVGRVSDLVTGTVDERSPLEERLDRLGRRLVWITLGIAAAVTALGLLRGEPLWRMVETGIALAIAAVPEGLPMVATLTLALGTRRMARRGALVRRLPAVETLGSATVVCTDKTGTLTAGEMTLTVLRVAGGEVRVTGAGYGAAGGFEAGGEAVEPDAVPGLRDALVTGLLANRAGFDAATGEWSGDPTEVALLVAAAKAGLDRRALLAEQPVVGEVPFSSERQLMASFHRGREGRGREGGVVAHVKGAPGRLVELAAWEQTADGRRPFDAAARDRLLAANRELAGSGLRVLALGQRELEPGSGDPGEAALEGLTLLGLAAVSDPPAAGVAEAVASFHRAGVRTLMITGDQELTARAIAEQLGLVDAGEEATTAHGRQLVGLEADELAALVGRTVAFSRTSPEQKLRIVEALQRQGEIVAMLGDGVNDAPALKRADIGVAMGGRGTDVAKETADLVLQDDRFETVVAAVEEGRVIFDNIRKFVFYLFSCNLAEVLVLFLAGLAGLPLPLAPLQLLWLNLITDVLPALSLAVEPAEDDVLRRPPRDPSEGVVNRSFLGLVGGYGALMTAASLGVFVWALETGREPERASTLAFLTLAFTQLLHVLNARSPRPVLFSRRLFGNRASLAAVVSMGLLQIAAVEVPVLREVLDTVVPTGPEWAVVLAAAGVVLVVGQAGSYFVSSFRRAIL